MNVIVLYRIERWLYLHRMFFNKIYLMNHTFDI